MSSFIQYIKDTRGEFKHVSWPTTNQTTNLTILVIGISLVVAFLLFVFDSLFIYLLSTFVI